MKTIIAGSRSLKSRALVDKTIADVLSKGHEITEVVSGTAQGIDTTGEKWAKDNGIPVRRFPAAWSKIDVPGAKVKTNRYGRKYNANAGHDRNRVMANYADALILIHKDTPGSRSMLKIALELGLKVFEYRIQR